MKREYVDDSVVIVCIAITLLTVTGGMILPALMGWPNWIAFVLVTVALLCMSIFSAYMAKWSTQWTIDCTGRPEVKQAE